VLLIDDGVYSGLGLEGDSSWSGKDIGKHLEMLEALGVAIYADRVSAESRGLALAGYGVKTVDEDVVADLLGGSDVTIT